jgi:galactokinase/mevalonate kinase-like predicted kinase
MIKISTPGRICLFGEHQDYLGLPVIAAAISRRVDMSGEHRADKQIIIHLPDIGSELLIEISATRIPYENKRDYFRSGYNVLIDKGLTFSKGLECTVRGNIPINSGTSSSSALLVTWIHFLSKMADILLRKGSPRLALLCINEAKNLSMPVEGVFVEKNVYNYVLDIQKADALHLIGQKEEAKNLFNKVLNMDTVPEMIKLSINRHITEN